MDRTPTYDDTPDAEWRVDEDRVVSVEDRAELADALVDRANSACTEATWLAEQARDGFLEDERITDAVEATEELLAFLRQFEPEEQGT